MSKAETLYQLGLDYYQGNGYPKDIDIAIDYLIKASELNHFEAKVLSGKLLFNQSKNPKSIYYEDGYQLGSQFMIDVFRSGKVELSIPYLLNNEIFNNTCTLEEMEDYYQKAYGLGYRETKYELAKILLKRESYRSAEQWFLESIQEDLSKEAHLYLYQIYQTKELYNGKKAFLQLKEALKHGLVAKEFQDFIEEAPDQILMHKDDIHSNFSLDKIKNEVMNYIEHCYYIDDDFKQYFSKDKLDIHVIFQLKIKLLNAAYDYEPIDGTESFNYEPYVLTEGYFAEGKASDEYQETVFVNSKISTGFFQSSERDHYEFLKLRELFDLFNLKNQIPHLETSISDHDIDELVQSEIKNDIKKKHKEKAKQLKITVKKFNIYKTLVPTFELSFKYKDKTYTSKKYEFDAEEWQELFKDNKKEDTSWVHLDFEFPLKESLYEELEALKMEEIRYIRKYNALSPLKIILFILNFWMLSIGLRNIVFNNELMLSNFKLLADIGSNVYWYLGVMLLAYTCYYILRIKINLANVTNIREKIIDNPEFVLGKNVNEKHFKGQYKQILGLIISLIILVLASGFFFQF